MDAQSALAPWWRGLRWGVKGMALLLVLAVAPWLWQAGHNLLDSQEVRRSWIRHPAEVTNLSSREWVELEVARELLPQLGPVQQPSHATPADAARVRIVVPREPLDGLRVFDAVELARHPTEAGRLTVISPLGDAMVLGATLLGCLPALALAVWLWRRRWGQDLTWQAGQWIPTDEPPAGAPGRSAPPTQVLTETASDRRALRLGVAMFCLVALLVSAGAAFGGGASSAEIAIGMAIVLGLLGLAAAAMLRSRSRRVAWDERGLCDASWFGARRVAWSDAARLDQVNLAENEQRRYDQASIGSGEREGSRPADVRAWQLRDAAGRELMLLPWTLEPASAWGTLRRRLEGLSR